MNGATSENRNYYAENYIALLDSIVKNIQSIVNEIKKALDEV